MNSDFAIAMHCLLLLALSPDQMVKSTELANRACVHPVRIRKILSLLKRKHYIQSKEGACGGFFLSSDPREVTLDQIYQLTSSGTLQPRCPQKNEGCMVGAHMEETLNQIFSQAEQQVEHFLRQFTVWDVLNLIKEQQTKS